MIALGNNIKAARKKLGLTQEELAYQIGVTSQAVSRWESGVGMPDISLVVPLAQVLAISTDALFGLEQTSQEEADYIEIKNHLDEINHSNQAPEQRALQACHYLNDLLSRSPSSHVISCFYAEGTANLSRYVHFQGYIKDEWPKFRDTALRYGTNIIRFCENKEFVERAHYALAWIYIHEKDYVSAREHINTLPSIGSNRLQESILAQLTFLQYDMQDMKTVLRKNLQNFTRALNKEILYAMECFAYNDEPESAVQFGLWGLDIIRVLSKNPDLISFCRGFTRDLYKYILQADLRAEKYDDAVRHFEELKEAMQLHFEHYQKVLGAEEESSKYNSRTLRNMRSYTTEFMKEKQQDILNHLEYQDKEKFQKFMDALKQSEKD